MQHRDSAECIAKSCEKAAPAHFQEPLPHSCRSNMKHGYHQEEQVAESEARVDVVIRQPTQFLTPKYRDKNEDIADCCCSKDKEES